MAIMKSISEKYMNEALKQAKKAYSLGEVPIGCVIVHEGKIIGRGYNRRNTDKTTLAHAEISAISKASKIIGDWRLEECTMYVTLEPCQMCAGAIVQARIPEVVIGCMNPKAGCAGSILNILEMPQFNHQVQVTRRVLETECSEMLKTFFAELRIRTKAEQQAVREISIPKTKEIIRQEIRGVELEWKKVFSVEKKINKRLYKWQDDTLQDMYDHNPFVPVCDTPPTQKDFERAVAYQKEHGWNFLKFDSRIPLNDSLCKELEEQFGLDGGETYTMYLPEKQTENWKRNEQVTVLDVQTDDIAAAIEEIEVKNYAKRYGENFTVRKVKRYVRKAKKLKALHYFGAFIDGKIVGACYAYVKNGYVMMDSLIVNEEARNQYVATTLMAHIAEHFKGTLFLHADPDDTPKDMYAKMGFEVIDSVFEYCATWK